MYQTASRFAAILVQGEGVREREREREGEREGGREREGERGKEREGGFFGKDQTQGTVFFFF